VGGVIARKHCGQSAGGELSVPDRSFRERISGVLSIVEIREQFAANLRGHRERQGLSQERLGRVCGLHRTEISLLERCKRSPRLETIVVLARALELDSPGELLDGIL
jgi:DNA-binding XRE family transcriptional regulator